MSSTIDPKEGAQKPSLIPNDNKVEQQFQSAVADGIVSVNADQKKAALKPTKDGLQGGPDRQSRLSTGKGKTESGKIPGQADSLSSARVKYFMCKSADAAANKDSGEIKMASSGMKYFMFRSSGG